MHIHVKGSGECPTADDSRLHNGRLATSTTDGLRAHGAIGTSLTTDGGTSPAGALAVDRFPAGGTSTSSRTIAVTDDVARQVRDDNAVVVIHGIDYNENGEYDSVLDAGELNPVLPQEATAPALCGPLRCPLPALARPAVRCTPTAGRTGRDVRTGPGPAPPSPG
ncbi:hypothetical protein [Kitasatospora sp. NPDC091207]|uniref:hypothetical protein n=1 Tax=Kitasatospora sp. NPDC091207 TaxID=3364083 RepID=UPI00382A0814